MPTHEREITVPTDLCLPDGRLNPEAVGWTRRPLHRANLRGWGRAKRWEYWGIVTPGHIVGIVASSLDYAGLHGVYVLDRATGAEISKDVVVPLARGAVLPERSGEGTASVRGGGVTVEIGQAPGGSSLRAVAPGVELDLEIPLPEGHESLGVGAGPVPVHGQGRRAAGARAAETGLRRAHRERGGLLRGARPRPGEVAVLRHLELGRGQRPGPGDPARREVDRRHRRDGERAVRGRAAAQDR
ncbi:hypothetical protein Pve01_30270 [Planomonospora venezuelensis]|uniref:DUF2804 family protein n=1 Tax=Planomonospora venezuelensis TaxID=1999 RepID=A0A841D4X4_PLAVE|nr:hypothetical protein [Planomonospora venezuelensis]GIN01369.1 hypothetical protein Pve01_30270 [Planomonospora venezuelensis]